VDVPALFGQLEEPSLEKQGQVLPYQQETQHTCSAACLRAVLLHYGLDVPEKKLAELIGVTKNGAEVDQITSAAKKLGFHAYDKSLTVGEAKRLLKDDVPIICDIQSFTKPGTGHYVVLTSMDEDGVELMDPNVKGNHRRLTHEEWASRWWDNAMKHPHEDMVRWGVVISPAEKTAFVEKDDGFLQDASAGAKNLFGHIQSGVGGAISSAPTHPVYGVSPGTYASGAVQGVKNFFSKPKGFLEKAAPVSKSSPLKNRLLTAGEALYDATEGTPVAQNLSGSVGGFVGKLVHASAKIKKEKRRPWNVANVRSGRRPMSVDTMLKKEKDGTLGVKFAEAVEKISQFYGPIVPFSDEQSLAAAPRGKKNPDNIPSRESIVASDVKREDGRANLVTEMAPGTNLYEVAATNQPQERTASARYTVADLMLDKVAGLRDYILSDAAEKHTDLGGLGLMAASSIDKLRSQLKHPEDPERGSLVGGTAGRTGMDLTGLGLMAAPTLARLATGTGNRFTNVANLAGLGALAVPTADNLQAAIRARRAGVDPEKKMLLGHKAHSALELAGLGTLAVPVARGGLKPSSAATLAGYGTLAAPVVEDLVQHDENKKIFKGPGRSAAELAGLGLLAGGALSHGH
jgi:predicted double-glycine peptidase